MLVIDYYTLYPAHPTLWMCRQAPDPPFVPNPTGKLDPVSPLAAARSQPSQEAPLLWNTLEKYLFDAFEPVTSIANLGLKSEGLRPELCTVGSIDVEE